MGYWVWRRWGRENEKKKYVYKKSSKKEQNCFMLMDWPIILPCRSLTDALYTVLSIWCTGILYSQIFQWIIHIFFQRNPLFYDHWHWQYCCPYQIQSLSQMHYIHFSFSFWGTGSPHIYTSCDSCKSDFTYSWFICRKEAKPITVQLLWTLLFNNGRYEIFLSSFLVFSTLTKTITMSKFDNIYM